MQRYKKLLEDTNRPISVAIAGFGFMGSLLYSQLKMLKGFEVSLVYGRDIQKIKNNLHDNILIFDNLDKALDIDFDIGIDCTGDANFGAIFAEKVLKSKRDVVSLNVETDSAIGPLLNKIAIENDVVYSGILGDEPGAIKELYDFSTLMGFEVICVGKGKNNPLDREINPSLLESEAREKNISPYKLCSFVDGTNTMIELSTVGNSIGFTPDIPGCHGVKVDKENIADLLSTQGILKSEKVLEYVFGLSPGVFAIIRTDNPQMDYGMRFLKMGKGPNYLLYRPFHLTSMEVPITLYKVYFDRTPSIAPVRQINDVYALAKKDLYKGGSLDGIGGYTCYGRLERKSEKGAIPIALIDNNAQVIKDIKKGEPLTYENTLLSNNKIKELRDIQDKLGL